MPLRPSDAVSTRPQPVPDARPRHAPRPLPSIHRRMPAAI
ncbi:hypothetical protein LA76x_2474 [Lysobacter antibioticus]|uniref:Uncharacterized protein n=1 Tax=Lysobacter antibioticus TaxID=84531 RepID=A0A0S2FAQ0_LYSAN|nr:hypothetical protein LA76x_2474 [Lysobacter antibioticus]